MGANPNGIYELNQEDRTDLIVNPHNWPGKLVKQLCNYGYLTLNEWDGAYKVLLLIRNPAEIRKSYERLMGYKLRFTVLSYENQPMEEAPWQHLTDEIYEGLMIRVARQLQLRSDIDYVAVDGGEVVRAPLKFFSWLRSHGWPIDTDKAAGVVNPELYRNRA
jgi:hypothetical protein